MRVHSVYEVRLRPWGANRMALRGAACIGTYARAEHAYAVLDRIERQLKAAHTTFERVKKSLLRADNRVWRVKYIEV